MYLMYIIFTTKGTLFSNDTKQTELLLIRRKKLHSYYFLCILQVIFPISQNKLGRHEVPFVVMCHKRQNQPEINK